MRVMCIERSSYPFSIEVGDWLEVHDDSAKHSLQMQSSRDYTYTFEMDDQEWFTERSKYITLHQWRQNQLKKIGL